MATAAPVPANLPALFDHLVDDAAVFPPGNLPLPSAVTAHLGHRRQWYAPFVGPLLCPSSRLAELGELITGTALDVRVVVDTGTAGVLEAVDTVTGDSRMVLRGVELALRGDPLADTAARAVAAVDAALGGPDDDVPAYVEVPLQPGWERALDVVAEAGHRAKLRTGTPEPGGAPPEADVAAFLTGCLDREVAFKCTAGLHHAVRHTVGDHAEHGFLNVALAVGDILAGAERETAAATLADGDVARVTGRAAELPTATATSVRRWFRSFGSCSIDDPLGELVRLRLVDAPDTLDR
ncbi:hypothetical protein CLV30_12323 [Haloactinopolyspora alba]|uniref:Uncharacterized protein n=1 Tax=Haloactinopolyspora alba TaxID=648780 RepID=A0A2P8DJ51_9ACTN|nr:hypothetical protein [Haloactinopolyspora alba]PSK97224.1 hypothetical protein CLV30_12323 [Haloactinopolyspora alba]